MKTNDFVDWMQEMNKVFESGFGEMICENCTEIDHDQCAGNIECDCCMAC